MRNVGPIILGLNGGTASAFARTPDEVDNRYQTSAGSFHDSAAVLLIGGEVVAAVEEERLTRLKHTNRFPVRAIQRCLSTAGITIQDLDRVGYFASETSMDAMVSDHILRNPTLPASWTGRSFLAHVIGEELGQPIAADRIEFVEHHTAHAASAFYMSPFTAALVVTLDGQGDGLSGSVSAGVDGDLTRIVDTIDRDSLGLLYYRTIRYLGYGLFDEYKVMGLAPYGDPRPFADLFDSTCRLEPDGRVRLDWTEHRRISELLPPRRQGEPIRDTHRNLAASLQQSLERSAFHILKHHRRETGLRHLCVAGGVAHNSTLVGKLARSGLFDGVFVQPASHDAGCALGAALMTHRRINPSMPIVRQSHVYWGTDIGTDDRISKELDAWSELLDAQKSANISDDVAKIIVSGGVIGWIQGRSEFGPRALGNRSILADARDARNRVRINEIVKMREAYRPFAPAVIEEAADQFFEMPPFTDSSCMTFTTPVREQVRALLAAVTHIDGTARVQTVSRATNPRFWALLDAFGKLTGTPVLLNTSFNHSVEPIVDSIDDAIICYLTTKLDYLVVGDWLVRRREGAVASIASLVPVLPDGIRARRNIQCSVDGRRIETSIVEDVVQVRRRIIDGSTFELLMRADGLTSIHALMKPLPEIVLEDLWSLWQERLVKLTPVGVAMRHRAGAA
jgi:carbamoyltransferase